MRFLSRVPLHPLLFAAYGVLFLYAANLALVLPVDVVAPLGRSLAGAAVALVVLSVLYGSPRRGAIVATALVVAYFAFGHVERLVAGLPVAESLQLIAWGTLVAAVAVYAARAGASLSRATAGLNVAALILVILAGVTIVPYEVQRAGRSPVASATAVTAAPVGRKPDIYFFIFDRYGSPSAIKRRFGLEQSDLYAWLESRGFKIPADARGSYRATDFSLASTLNMRYLDELTQRIGPVSGDRTPAKDMIQHHEVGQFLKSLGYTYYHLGSWFDPTRTNPEADVNLTLGVASEFESVLHDTTVMPALERLARGGAAIPAVSQGQAFLDRVREGTLYELRQLHRLVTAPGPKFVFAHILLPHDPYVFRADGSLMTEAEAHATDEPTLYAGHRAFADAQIKSLVGDLLSGPASARPIVILEGDEGPLACQAVDCVGTTSDYFSIRMGVLNAMYLPGYEGKLPDPFWSVNTFRFLFHEYFGADLPLLPGHSYTWPDNDHIYDFQDVTDLVNPSPP